MNLSKIAITVPENILHALDMLVEDDIFPNRSKAIQEAIADKLLAIKQQRFAAECAKLDPAEEQEMAEEWAEKELAQWVEF